MSQTMKFKNPTGHTLNLASVGLGKVNPGETVDIPIELCAATIADNGSRGKSSIECVAPQLVPADPTEGEFWAQTPEPLPPKSLMVTVSGRAPSEPPGVAAVRKAQQEAAAKKAKV